MKNLYNFLTQCARRTLFLHKTTFLLLIALGLFGLNESAWADACNYINNQGSTINTYQSSSGWHGIGAKYKFYAENSLGSLSSSANTYGVSAISCKVKLNSVTGGKSVKAIAQYKVGSGSWSNIGTEQTISNGREYTFSSSSLSIAKNQQVSFQVKVTSTTEYGQNRSMSTTLNVTMAKSMSANSTAAMSFGEVEYGKSGTAKTSTITYSNVETGKTMSIELAQKSSDFTVSLNKTNLDCWGTVTATMNFTPQGQGLKKDTAIIKSTNGVTSIRIPLSGTGLLANSALSMNNGSVNVSIAGINSSTLDLSTLIASQTGNGGVTYQVISATGGNATTSTATIDTNDKKTFSATEPGTYTIRATKALTDQYNSKTADFTVTVNKLVPTIVWEEPEHIYSGDQLTNPASLFYNGNSVSGVGITYASGNTSVMTVDNTKHELYAQPLQTAQDVVITATTKETDYYKSVNTPTKTYHVEAAQTPVFKLNGQILAAQDTTIRLKIGETANMAFDKIEENQFTYPTTPGAATYAHNSSNHTGVITAESYGNRTLVFEQKGTTTTFGQKHNVTVYVDKHPVTLELTSAFDTKTWLVDDIFTDAIYTVNTPTGNQPAQNNVVISSSNENAFKQVNGQWKAVGEGDATITIAQQSNDYWTGDTITKSIHVSKHTPEITWNISSSLPWGTIISNPVTSTNTDVPFTLTSNNKSVADYVDGKIEVYNVNGSVTFTLRQSGNYKWDSATVNITNTFSAYQPANHVEFTIGNSNHTTFDKNKLSSYASWNSSGYYRLGHFKSLSEFAWYELLDVPGLLEKAAENHDDYFIIEFSGVPKELSFEKELEKDPIINTYLPESRNCYVYESPDGTANSWDQVWYDNSESPNPMTNIVKQLKPSTRFVKFRYFGTLYCQYKNINITERKEIVAPEEHDFLSGGIGDNPTTHKIDIKWYNVKTCTVTIDGADAKYFQLGDDSKTIASHIDAYSETEKITVRYLHEEIKEHTAKLHITSEDGKSATVTLKGKTTHAAQEITWNPDYIVDGKLLIAKDALYTDIATASSGGEVELSELNNTLLTIDGNSITGHIEGTEGTTKLQAYQAGNDNKWAKATATIDVVITSKTVQNIIWDDELSNFKYAGSPIDSTLTAFSSVDRNLQITYELDENAQAFATLNGNKLTINGTGTGTITAKQVGNNTYVAVTASKTITSYNPNSACAQSNLTASSTSFSLDMGKDKTIDLTGGEADKLTFTAKVGKSSILNVDYYDGSWHNICSLTEASSKSYGPYNLSRGTTQIRFQATMVPFGSGHEISNAQVTKARYLEAPDAENNLDFSAVQLGQTVKRQFAVNYSDASGVFEVKLANASDQFKLQSYTLGSGCGDTKENAIIKINCTGKRKGKETNAIVISNKTNSITIPLTATVKAQSQQIYWDLGDRKEILTTNDVTLSATAGSNMPVTFSSSDNSIAEVKNVNGQYVLDIKQGDTIVTITASQEGDDSWEPTSKSCKFAISKVTPTVTKDPTAQEVSLPATLADCALSNDFTASVPGSFDWKTPTTQIERFNNGYTAVFTPEKSGWYKTVERTIVVPVAKIPQTINWTVADADREIFCNANVTFNATAQYGTSVYFISSDDEIAYVDVNQVLHIFQGGTVKLTAKTDGDATYARAQKEYTFTIKRVSPTIVTYPVADTMKVSGLLSNATIRGGLVKLGDVTVGGSFSWVDGNTTAMNEAGTFTKEILFTPTEAGWYEPVTGKTLSVVVEKYAPVITDMNLTAADITYGTVLSGTTGLTGSIEAIDTVKKPNVAVQGSYAWVSKAELYDVHTTTATAVFKPENGSWYNDVEVEVPITVLPKQLTTCTATAELAFGQKLSEAVFTNTTTGLSGEDVDGIITWNENVNTNVILAVQDDPYEFDINFESLSDNYADGYGKCYVTIIPGVVFNGEGGNTTWSDADNWLGGDKPEATDRVVIDANVDITGNITIGGITINAGNTVTVTDGASLTIGDKNSITRDAGYGNIIVEAGGQLILSNEDNKGNVHVNNFTLYSNFEAEQPKSGQVSNPTKLTTHGDAYFILDLDPSGSASYGWYSFTVPFHVDALNGVYRLDNGNWVKAVNEVNYAIMDYHEDLRAQGKYGWKKYRSTLQPGVGYLMTVENQLNRYRFTKTKSGNFNTEMTQTLTVTDGADKDKGWNSLGNGTTSYVTYASTPRYAQLYNHSTNAYDIELTTGNALVVGAAYFVQAETNNSTITMQAASDATTGLLRAPQRDTESDICFVNLSLRNNGKSNDKLFITCDDNAAATYTIGKDVVKMGATSGISVARLWANAKNATLGAVDVAYSDDKAIIPLGIYTPAAGEYTIAIDNSPTEDVYLTRNGIIVWNLSMSDYTFDFNAGTDTSYALQVVRRINNTATGVDELDNDKRGTDFVEKIIVNGQLYILRDGMIYDAQGKKVSNF